MAETPNADYEWPKATGLTPAQRALLHELRSGPGLYIHRYKRYARTIEALERRGLVRCDAPDFSRMGQDHWVAVAAHSDGSEDA